MFLRVRYTAPLKIPKHCAARPPPAHDARLNRRNCLPVGLPSGRPGATVPFPFKIRDAHAQQVTSNHMDDGLHSELFHVSVTVNAVRIRDDQIPGITDYVAMLALAQTTKFETCASLHSIANIVTDNCPSNSQTIGESDLAYLRALYKTDTTRTLAQQRRDMRRRKKKAA
jgi:hypothetical protein